MSLFITSINSGSNGNCYYIGNSHEAVLIDAGISCRETEKRLKRLGLNIQKIKGAEVLTKKYRLPVYITKTTHKHSKLKIANSLVRSFAAYDNIVIGDII